MGRGVTPAESTTTHRHCIGRAGGQSVGHLVCYHACNEEPRSGFGRDVEAAIGPVAPGSAAAAARIGRGCTAASTPSRAGSAKRRDHLHPSTARARGSSAATTTKRIAKTRPPAPRRDGLSPCLGVPANRSRPKLFKSRTWPACRTQPDPQVGRVRDPINLGRVEVEAAAPLVGNSQNRKGLGLPAATF